MATTHAYSWRLMTGDARAVRRVRETGCRRSRCSFQDTITGLGSWNFRPPVRSRHFYPAMAGASVPSLILMYASQPYRQENVHAPSSPMITGERHPRTQLLRRWNAEYLSSWLMHRCSTHADAAVPRGQMAHPRPLNRPPVRRLPGPATATVGPMQTDARYCIKWMGAGDCQAASPPCC